MEQTESEPAGDIEAGESYCVEIPVNANPKSSNEVYQVIETIHKTIVRHIKTEKPTRGFAFSTLPGGELVYHTLIELQEDPSLIECNSTVYTDVLKLLGTYNYQEEYVFVIRVDNEAVTRFVVNIGPLDEAQAGAIKTLEEVKEIERATLLTKALLRTTDLRNKRSGNKRKDSRKNSSKFVEFKGFARKN